jgi:serine protease Do
LDMSRLMFVYLSGTEKGKTRIFTQDHVTVGTSDVADLKLVPEEGGQLPDGILADVFSENGFYRLTPRETAPVLELAVNGEKVSLDDATAGLLLRDGDTLHFGHGLSSASVLFQVMPANFAGGHPVRRAGTDIEAVGGQTGHPHPLTATLFVKELTSSLWAEIPRRVKVSTVTVAGCFAIMSIAVAFYGLLTLYRVGKQNERLSGQADAEMARRQQDQEVINGLRLELEHLREESQQNRLFAQNIAERYSPGVCLIVGSYSFSEHGTGRLLRYESSDRANDIPVDSSGNLLASVDGVGPAVQIEFSGTGFVVEDGVIATNKHVVQPWANDQPAQVIINQGGGFRPRLDSLVAFFPSLRAPYELKVLLASERYDIALCSFVQGNTALPSLPLEKDETRSIIGEPVVLLGYPTGVDGMLQRIDEDVRRAIQSGHSKSVEDVAAGLSARGLVRPLTTSGIISDALPGRIVHSAHTTEGGSGGPLFDRDYHVIAINSAILASTDGGQSFGGSNFGVPIKAVAELLDSVHQGEGKKQ